MIGIEHDVLRTGMLVLAIIVEVVFERRNFRWVEARKSSLPCLSMLFHHWFGFES
jgi:hypothetical protein